MIGNSHQSAVSAGAGGEPLQFRPALKPRAQDWGETRLLWIDTGRGSWSDSRLDQLPRLLEPEDLLVVNDAATLPASLPALTRDGARVEIRLAAERENGAWDAVLFGEGDWHDRTEERAAPPAAAGAR